jgi:hypothetical protein
MALRTVTFGTDVGDPAGAMLTAQRSCLEEGPMNDEERRCPRCGSHPMRPVQIDGRTNLLCVTCHRCWFREHGYLIEVNRYACPGCAARAVCLSL